MRVQVQVLACPDFVGLMMSVYILHAHASEVAERDGWVRVVPSGSFSGIDGRGPYHLTDGAAVIARTKAIGPDVCVDYNHGAVTAVKNGQEARAAGWVTDWQSRPDGIYAKINWNSAAIKALDEKEYRYISPVMITDDNNNIKSIHSIGLVNTPNIAQLPAIASQEAGMKPEEMMAWLKTMLKLPDTATPDQIKAKLEASMAKKSMHAAGGAMDCDDMMAALSDALGMPAGTDWDAMIAKIKQMGQMSMNSAVPDPAKYVPMAAFMDLNKRVTAMAQDSAQDKAQKAVDAAMQAGKVTPAMQPWALELASSNLKAFQDFVGTVPPIVAPGGLPLASNAPPPSNPAVADAALLAVCSQMGLDPAYVQKEFK